MKKNNTLKGRPERATAGKVSIATEHAGGVGGGGSPDARAARRERSDAPEARLLAGEVGADTGGRRHASAQEIQEALHGFLELTRRAPAREIGMKKRKLGRIGEMVAVRLLKAVWFQ